MLLTIRVSKQTLTVPTIVVEEAATCGAPGLFRYILVAFQEEDFGPAETTLLPTRRRLMTELSDPNENDLRLFPS